MGKVIAALLFASVTFAQYYPPLGGGSSSGNIIVNGTTCTIGSSCTVTTTPCGATNQIQYNNVGACGADADFLWVNTALATPVAPTVTNIGSAGAVTYGYEIVARNLVGGTIAGAEGTTVTGNATLNGSNYNHLVWTVVTGAVSYDVFLTTAGGNTPTAGFLARVTANSYDHQGQDGDEQDPSIFAASTNGLYVGTNIQVGPQVDTLPQGIFKFNPPLPNSFTRPLGVYANATETNEALEAITVIAYSTGSGSESFGISGNGIFDGGAGVTATGLSGITASALLMSGNVAPYMDGARSTMGNLGSGTATAAWAYYTPRVINSGGGAITTMISYYSEAQGGVTGVPNAYGFWQDEQGVFRIRADNTFDSLYQAIPALYNPQFTKYTPGAANYERIVEQWNGNVAEIGTEKGGTGTLRTLRLIGQQTQINSLKTTGAATGKTVVCVDVSTGQLYASTSGVACAN